MLSHEITSLAGKGKGRRRVGRGTGTGHGKTCGRGHKGSKSRAGARAVCLYEGGQMPIHRRLPKRGFKNIFRKKIAAINIKDLKKFESGGLVDEADLVRRGIIKGQRDGVKLLGSGEIDRPLNIKVNQVSNNARKKIEAAGGSIEVV